MKKTFGFIGVTVLLVLTTALCVAGTVQSQSRGNMRVEECVYQQLEDGYVEEIRAYLTEEGYVNSGIMLTRTICEDGTREYQLVVHNSRFSGLTEAETDVLEKTMTEKAFAAEGCSFNCLVKGNA